ncbi:PI-PLC domain-containing protein [Varunaivibrio sulfuroxidans]|uniref:hypothetical protein n=1 Tax=Varunaivibrio sulfuroxidans TaxID=1773489 RepID=UPI001042D7D0|nr:hypothetical protein [Varunaivibrio sulfuroxidans]WES31672.1 hypothetical protein P3M64_04685 [Varunaivibrio sulfuroxidans]
MEKLNIIYRGAHSNPLYTANFDGVTWHGNTKISAQPGGVSASSPYNPSAAVLNGWLYIVYKSASSADICCAWFDGSKWHGGVKIKTLPGGISPQSNHTPNIAVYKGLLFMVYLDPGSHDVYTAWFDGTTWYGNTKISDQSGGITPQSALNPAIAAYEDDLYIVYLGKWQNWLYSASFNGITWDGNVKISDQPGGISPRTATTPGMCVYDGKLYLAYGGIMTNKFYTATFDGATWAGNTEISVQPGDIDPASSDNPGMIAFTPKGARFGEELYLIYKGAWFTDLYSCKKKASEWYGNTEISDQPGGISPASGYRPAVCVLAGNPGTQANWMSKLPDATLLGAINIPGSHDSAAINTSRHTPYACHNRSITDQLEFGIRLLDIRLQVVKNDDNTYTFNTCHGPIGSTGGFNTYQTFSSLMDECKTFLTTNDKETILALLRVDDWYNVPKNDPGAYTALQADLAAYPVVHPKAMPTLGGVRGKIVLYNGMNGTTGLGIPLSWEDGTEGKNANSSDDRSYEVYVQDKYDGLPLTGSVAAKLKLVTDAFGHISAGNAVWNFASAVWYGLFGVYIMSGLLSYFGEKTGANRPATFGWTLFDYPFNQYNTDTYGAMSIVSLILDSNFGYANYPNKFNMLSEHDEL